MLFNNKTMRIPEVHKKECVWWNWLPWTLSLLNFVSFLISLLLAISHISLEWTWFRSYQDLGKVSLLYPGCQFQINRLYYDTLIKSGWHLFLPKILWPYLSFVKTVNLWIMSLFCWKWGSLYKMNQLFLYMQHPQLLS